MNALLFGLICPECGRENRGKLPHDFPQNSLTLHYVNQNGRSFVRKTPQTSPQT